MIKIRNNYKIDPMIVIFSVGKYRRRKIRPLGLRARLCAAL